MRDGGGGGGTMRGTGGEGTVGTTLVDGDMDTFEWRRGTGGGGARDGGAMGESVLECVPESAPGIAPLDPDRFSERPAIGLVALTGEADGGWPRSDVRTGTNDAGLGGGGINVRDGGGGGCADVRDGGGGGCARDGDCGGCPLLKLGRAPASKPGTDGPLILGRAPANGTRGGMRVVGLSDGFDVDTGEFPVPRTLPVLPAPNRDVALVGESTLSIDCMTGFKPSG